MLGVCKIAHCQCPIKSTRPAIYLPSHYHLPSHDYPRRPCTDMDIRDSLSRLKKKVGRKISSRKREPDGTVDEFGGGRAGETDSLSRPVSRGAAGGGHSRGTNKANTDEQEVRSTGEPTPDVTVHVPARGSADDQGGVEGGIGGGEPSHGYSHPRSDARVTVGSGPSQQGNEVDREKDGGVYPSPSTPSITHIARGPDCMGMSSIHLPSLIVPSDNTGASTIPDHVPDAPRPDERVEPSTAVGTDWKSTASSTAKLLLRWARDSSDAFGPLKSVTAGLCFILQNFEVCPTA